MNKYVLSFLLLLVAVTVMGQKKSKVNLISSQSAEAMPGANGKKIIKVFNGIFKQDFSTLRSDSALFYPDLNMVDAFGHVVINQGDTLNIYSDKLNYNGNTKIAILTDNVKMVDKDATLTTNYFTYNTATRIGTYTGGGKLVNKDNTLVSKNGYYFAFTRDSYFRYDVVCTTSDAIIKTDTLRYNSGTRITYFYGPTNIYGTKDKDVLYTENGNYNTIPEQAYFGKNNLYTQGTKSLKGDSLFYDRLKGYGRAVKHVTFYDSEQKATIKGDLGEYYKAEEKTVMTQNPYMIFVTEDTTKTDTSKKAPGQLAKADSAAKKLPAIINANKKVTVQTVADSVNKRLPGTVNTNNINKKMTLQAITDSVTKKLPATINSNAINKKLTLQGVTDSVMKRVPQAHAAIRPALTKQQNAALKSIIEKKPTDLKGVKELSKVPKNAKYDSLYFGADTLETQILTYKALKTLQQDRFMASHRDTSIKIVPHIVYKTSPKFLTLLPPKMPVDTSYIHRNVFGKPIIPAKPAPKPVKAAAAKKAITDPLKIKQKSADSLKIKQKADSIALSLKNGLSDTSRVRIIVGHHHSKLFKSDLQAKSDSMFYSNSDSTIRCYVNPMIWTQGSQLSGDTINLQMKNRKLDNMDMFPSAFIVNIEKTDSLHFNQMGGKKMHGVFRNNKLSMMVITGNAETIYFNRDTIKHVVTEMQRSVSAVIKVNFKDGQVGRAGFYTKAENHVHPIGKVKDEDKILKGFIWKPKERPLSKESILSGYKKPVTVKKDTTMKGAANKKPGPSGKPVLKPGVKSTGKDITKSISKDTTKILSKDTTMKPPVIKSGKDSTLLKKNSIVKRDSTVKDTSAKPNAPAKKPGS